MKLFTIILLSLCLLLNIKATSQEIKFDSLSTASGRGVYTSYVSKDGTVYKIGDRLKIGVPHSNRTFGFLYMTAGILSVPTPLTIEFSGTEAEIKKIQVGGTKRSGYMVYFVTKGNTAMVNYQIQIEGAIENGEIKTSGKTSDEALAELKKAKDKLDLGLITQEDYNNIKIELVKYIK